MELENGEMRQVPQCMPLVNPSNAVIRRQEDRGTEHVRKSRQLPPDYDGWLQVIVLFLLS